jgi:hypothetical protein
MNIGIFNSTLIAPTLASIAILLGVAAGSGNAQTLRVLASFSGSNGANPYAGLTLSGCMARRVMVATITSAQYLASR